MNELIIIDGNSLINRAFYAIPPLHDKQGSPTNAVYGFVNMLVRLIEKNAPEYMAVAFDLPKPTFRHLKSPDYKATRKAMSEDLASQIPKLKQLLRAMNIAVLELEGYEADDILGTVAKREKINTVIISGDKDVLQLIDDSTYVHLSRRGITETEVFDIAHFTEVYGFEPKRIVDLKALMGDSSDNIKGVAGVGEKTAMSLIQQYKSIDNIYENISDIKGKTGINLIENKDSAYLSYELATININVPLNYSLFDFKVKTPFSAGVKAMFESFNFANLLKKKIFEEYGAESAKEEIYQQGFDDARLQNEYSEVRASDITKIVELRCQKDYDKVVKSNTVAFAIMGGNISFCFDEKTEYRLVITSSLLDMGFDYEQAIISAKNFLEDESIYKIVFDYKELYKHLQSYGIILRGSYFDLQLAQYCIDCTKNNTNIIGVLDNFGLGMSTSAVSGMMQLKPVMEKLLEEHKSLYYDIEFPLQRVLLDMEMYGMKIDRAVLAALSSEYMAILDNLTAQIYSSAGMQFNINSPKQLGEVLFDKLKLDSKVKTKTKQLSTNVEVLQDLEGAHPVIPLILRYRTVSKLNSTYIEGIAKMTGGDDIIHTVFKQTVTATGRLSSVEPNVQNIPVRDEEGRKVRKMFVARNENVLISADYSQIELRLLAHFSGCKPLLESYKNSEDIHTRTASDIFDVPIANVTKEMRRDAKVVNFGIIYGMSDFGLSKELGISAQDAHKYIANYFAKYPEVKSYMDSCVNLARTTKQVSTITGRIRKFNDINSSNYNIRLFNERAAMNMPLQGSSADLIKIAMINVAKAFTEHNCRAKLVCQVHDELIAEAHRDDAEKVQNIMRERMESALTLNVPLKVDISVGRNWYEL